ncbi:MAG: hypothetical protein ABSC38_01035 [Verrucomicrobiia bacterium]
MNTSDELATAKLVQVHKARNEMEGNLLVGYLQDNGIEAIMRFPPSVPPYDTVEWMYRNNKIYSISVRESDANRACQLIQEFLTTAADASSLEELAAQQSPLTKEKIGKLRGVLLEERRTFRFLGWLTAAFLLAMWLSIGSPLPHSGGLMLMAFMLLAMCVGYFLRKR